MNVKEDYAPEDEEESGNDDGLDGLEGGNEDQDSARALTFVRVP